MCMFVRVRKGETDGKKERKREVLTRQLKTAEG